ncbi:hypothetical protein [Paenibacillus polymyxa]|uniref:hypothetical protein n=1 Tax=Paenibacillus polymyxa TaxID=1406 RepID=UPI000471D2BA|nr:hypothetical protein [Paenibacillus polymyxa]WPQ58417.1 hypothetical protein SKN87_08210 [Paenibacillus polymyxa]
MILPKENRLASDVYGLNALPHGTRNPAGDYRYGASNNVISISGDKHGSVIGTGRGTNFTDEQGENGNTLRRCDCATKGDIDNPEFGTIIRVRNTDKDIVHEFSKADNGSLPDAIIDIWKTGVEDLGLTWHSYTSFSGRYSYNF